MSGYLISTAVLGTKVRDYTPEHQVGLFQGVRMVFVVMLPMVTGPYIGLGATNIMPGPVYINEYGQEAITPGRLIFLFTAIVLILALVPIILLIRKEKKDEAVQ